MQLPVISGLPAKVAVGVFPLCEITVSGTTSPDTVRYPEFANEDGEEEDKDEEVPVTEEAVAEPVTGATPRALALARALDNPAGEHPTKSGAVSLTAAHSCLLNCMAAKPPSQRIACVPRYLKTYLLAPPPNISDRGSTTGC